MKQFFHECSLGHERKPRKLQIFHGSRISLFSLFRGLPSEILVSINFEDFVVFVVKLSKLFMCFSLLRSILDISPSVSLTMKRMGWPPYYLQIVDNALRFTSCIINISLLLHSQCVRQIVSKTLTRVPNPKSRVFNLHQRRSVDISKYARAYR